ncbi:MAG: 3-dehydroquinate synthase [Chlorobi bacterium]|nr:3-dehydroquinate synthase [Chlorobiota bacterium]
MQSEFIQSSVKMVDRLKPFFQEIIRQYKNEKIFILMDENTQTYCYPVVKPYLNDFNITEICIKEGEKNKNINTVTGIWETLLQNEASKNSLFINLGGGIISDIGGFAASAFKRGMIFINIPTTLMGQIDAAIGGKNGINFNNFKNQVGVINQPKEVLIFPGFLKTLNTENILSGFAEIIKYRYISNNLSQKELFEINPLQFDLVKLNNVIQKSIEIKAHFVSADPEEKNIRKVLNFGHTFGHAFEALYAERNAYLLHGHAVAAGLICEIYLSTVCLNYEKKKLDELIEYILPFYGKLAITSVDFEIILSAMQQDKKNRGSEINFTLIDENEEVQINQNCSSEKIKEALNFYISL